MCTRQAGNQAEQSRQVGWRQAQVQAAGFNFRQVKHIAHQGQQVFAAVLDHVQTIHLAGGQVGVALEDLNITQDAVERGAQLVAHV